MKVQSILRLARVILPAAVLGLLLAGCGDFSNDNPAAGTRMAVDLSGMEQDIAAGGSLSSPGTTDAQSKVNAVVIGALVTDRSQPYNADTASSVDTDELEEDLINSVNFLTVVNLPTSDTLVEFFLPPPGAGNWQVFAVGTGKKITTLSQFEDEADSKPIYYGFTDEFYNTKDAEGEVITLRMKRACFVEDPPKGCAQYDVDLAEIVVTPSVEIVDVLADGSSIFDNAPFNNDPGVNDVVVEVDTSAEASQAEQDLDTLLDNANVTDSNTDEIVVVTTHKDSGGCDSFTYVSGTTSLSHSCLTLFRTPLDL